MKKITIAAIALLFSISLFAQPSGYNRLYNTYKGEEGVTSIRVPGILLKFAGMCAGLEHDERQLVRCLRSVTVLTIEDNHLYPGVNFTQEMDQTRMKGEYNLLLEVHDGDEDVIIAAREKRGKITDLIVVVGGEENTLVHVRGRMKSDLLGELAEASGIKELKITTKI
ncbi:MAG: DUF4252 domain-containing protein [Bacteroidetes bacterium]|nr:DUF4252 domain-containing protein [Bacteroidota bacterium]